LQKQELETKTQNKTESLHIELQ